MSYEVSWSRRARRALETGLPEAVAIACFEFITGPLAENPHRVGKALREPMDGWHSARRGQFRVIYQIHEATVRVHVIDVRHRADIYGRH